MTTARFGCQNAIPQYFSAAVSLKVNFGCQWWRASRLGRTPQNKKQDGVEGYIITSTILSLLLCLSFLLLFSFCFGTNRFICHIGHNTQSAGWLFKGFFVTGGGLVSLSTLLTTVPFIRGSARYKPSLRGKLNGRKWGGLVMMNWRNIQRRDPALYRTL